MGKLNWGLVGLGSLAEALAPGFASMGSGRLVACASRRRESAVEYAARHGVDRAYASYEELVRDPEVDAVFVATPNHLHHAVVLAAARAGKHVLCEKPMAPTAREAQEMIAACREAEVLLRIGFNLRFLKVIQEAKAAVQAGRLGEPREATVQRISVIQPGGLQPWRRELATAHAGVLADVGVHLIDFTRWILGDRVARVFGLAYPPRSSGRPDDAVTVLLELEGGCQATVRCNRSIPVGSNDLQLFGTLGALTTGPLRFSKVHRLTFRTPDSSEEREYPEEDSYRLELEAFGKEVDGEPTSIASAEDGLRVVRITEAIIRSFESGAAVEVGA